MSLEAVLTGEARYTALRGDNMDWLAKLPDASVDAVVCDPPYGLGAAPDMVDVLRAWLEDGHYSAGGAGFMGRKWDAFVPGPRVWREVHRVLKPGGHVLAFAGTRTWDVMSLAMRLAGFELRDTLQWLYGSGFPKSANVSKLLDRAAGAERGITAAGTAKPGEYSGKFDGRNSATRERRDAPATDAARQWDGWGTALKPSWEPVLVFRKPLEAGSVAAQVLATGTGAINVDACRVAYASDQDKTQALAGDAFKRKDTSDKTTWARPWMEDAERVARMNAEAKERAQAGRWPSNLILSHIWMCRPAGTKRVRGTGVAVRRNGGGQAIFRGENTAGALEDTGYADPDGMETVDAWECAPGCPVAELDRQSGTLKSGARKGPRKHTSNTEWGRLSIQLGGASEASDGGASRFFPTFHYCAKASRSEREAGLDHLPARTAAEVTGRAPGSAGLEGADGFDKNPYAGAHEGVPRRNPHPTVKPIALMRWLVRLVTPPGGLVLDPWMGSGSTGVAVMAERELGARFVGFELDEDGHEYVAIAAARMAHALEAPPEAAKLPKKRAEKARKAPGVDQRAATPVDAPTATPARRRRRTRPNPAEAFTYSLWGTLDGAEWAGPIETAVGA